MYNDKHSLYKWLVKSENKILGPYSFEQVEDLIRKKQISLIDEIRDSYTRWLYVRENPEFKDIVEAIRKELDSKLESTKTYQTISKTEEFSKTKTEVPIHHETDEHDFKDISVVKEIIQTQQQDKNQFYQEEASKREKVKLYGLPKDQRIIQKVDKSNSNFLIYIVALFLFIIASTAGFYAYQKYNQQKQEDLLAQQIKKYKFLGLDQKAIEIYNRLPEEQQRKILPNIIELLPQLEQMGSIKPAEIESLKNFNGLSMEQKAKLNLSQFWLAMQSQNLKLAQDYLVKASAVLPSDPLIKENDALVMIKKGQFDKALNIFIELNKIESSGRYLFGMAIALSGLPPAERIKFSPQISQLIEKYTYIYYDYKKELLMTQLLLAKQDRNDSLFQSTWKQFVSTPCQLSSYFKKPTLISPNSYSWRDLNDYVVALKPYLSPEENVIFEVHHQIELFQISAASQFLSQNSARISDAFMKQQLNMLIYHFQSRSSDIFALAKNNQLDMKSELNQFILAMNELEQDPRADLAKFIEFFKENKLSFYEDWIAITQLMKLKSMDTIKTFTRSHFLTVNNFIPAMEAKSLVE